MKRKTLDINSSVWVSASAGSGKTKTLVDRLLSLLINDVDISKILCITYTNTAATEMKNRIYRILSDWVVADDNKLKKEIKELFDIDNDLILNKARILFAKIIDNVDNLKIFTIHSFCQQIISRFPIEAGIYPNFKLMDENESKIIIKDIIEKTILNDSLYIDFKNMISENSEDKLFEKITNIVNKIKNIYNDFENIESNYYKELRKKLKIENEDENEVIDNFFNSLNSDILKKMESIKSKEDKKIRDFILKIEKCIEGRDIYECKSLFLTKENKKKVIFDGKTYNIFSEEAEKTSNFILELEKIKTYKLSVSLFNIAINIIKEYKKEKNNKGLLDFDDLLMITYNLLENTEYSAWINYKLDGNIEHLMLDEAQDTSYIQWKIIEKITEDFFVGETKSEKKRTIFIVGDEKQSIFKFQGANPKMFENKYKEFSHKIDSNNEKSSNENYIRFEKIKLEYCYRSTKEILELVDNMFNKDEYIRKISRIEKNIKHEVYRTGNSYIELWPLIKTENELEKDIENDKESKEDNNWKLDFSNEADKCKDYKIISEYIVKKINELVNSNRAIITKDGGKRKINYGDIMILFSYRNKDFISILTSKLNKNNIPNSGSDKVCLFKDLIIKDIISLLNFIVFNDDDLSIANIIKSPILNLKEEDLLNLCIYKNENKTTIFEALKFNYPEKYNFLLDIIKKSEKCGIYELIYYIIENNNIKNNIINRVGEDFIFLLEKFYDFIRNFENNYSSSLISFLNFISNNNDNEIKKDIDLNDNCVKIMTVHASKGLQAPIVFLTERKNTNPKIEDIVWHDNLPIYKIAKSDVLKNFKEDIKSDDNDEYFRLLYVALTRAENELYICSFKEEKSSDKEEDNWYNLVKNTLIKLKGSREVKFDFNNELKKIVYGEENYIDEEHKENLDKNRINDSYSNINEIIKKYEEKEKEINIVNPTQFYDHIDRDKIFNGIDENILRGKAVHKLLEVLPNVKDKEKVADLYLNNMFCTLKNKEIIKKQTIDIINKFDKFFNNKSKAEVPIIGKINDKIVSGRIDRLIEYDDKIIILDYKNTKKNYNRDNIPKEYINQMDCYKQLLKEIYTNKEIACYIMITSYCNLIEL